MTTIREFKGHIDLKILHRDSFGRTTYQDALFYIPNVKLKHFAIEAISLDAARMKELEGVRLSRWEI